MRLLLARHGETVWNTEGRYQGQTDIPLSQRGRLQAQALARRLAAEPLDAIYASDLQRAAETARMIAAARTEDRSNVPVRLDPRLREMSFGAWEGLTYAEMQQQAAELVAQWNADRLNNAPPGGETLAQMTARLQDLLKDVRGAHPQGTVLLVGHGGPLRVLACLALSLSPTAYWQFRCENASLSELQFHNENVIVNYWNDTSHLACLANTQLLRQSDEDSSSVQRFPRFEHRVHKGEHPGRLILLLGGARSGKSALALQIARAAHASQVLYIATAEAGDPEMDVRIARHRQERDSTWHTLEAPRSVAEAVRSYVERQISPRERNKPFDVAILDCLTLLVSNIVTQSDNPFSEEVERLVVAETEALVACARELPWHCFIVVSNEVGMGLVPPYPLGRAYRDLLGRANQMIAAQADEVYLLVAGIPLRLK